MVHEVNVKVRLKRFSVSQKKIKTKQKERLEKN